VDVTLPDGTRLRACGIFDRREDDDQPDFGLYMDERWQPMWPADVIDWPDFGLPSVPEKAAAQIRAAFARAQAGERVEVGCLGGRGRTGTVLACMSVLAGIPPHEAVRWVRRNYDAAAIETSEQEAWVLWFATNANESDDLPSGSAPSSADSDRVATTADC
jgi:hypothetical protein